MNHDFIEKNIGAMLVLVIVAISFGALVEIVPLFFIKQTTEPVEGLKPYTALQLEGRDIYIREGCNNCHSQMIPDLHAVKTRAPHASIVTICDLWPPYKASRQNVCNRRLPADKRADNLPAMLLRRAKYALSLTQYASTISSVNM